MQLRARIQDLEAKEMHVSAVNRRDRGKLTFQNRRLVMEANVSCIPGARMLSTDHLPRQRCTVQITHSRVETVTMFSHICTMNSMLVVSLITSSQVPWDDLDSAT
jgi:hypothetical protein